MDLPPLKPPDHDLVPGLRRKAGIGLPVEPGLVPVARPCLNCGYSLAGLHESGTCPECGSLIARSLHGNLLRYAEPRFLAILHRGALIAEIGLCTALSGVGLGIAGEVALAAWFTARPGRAPSVAEPVIGLTVGAGAVATVVGWWLLTTPDPADQNADRGGSIRGGLRGALLVAGAITILLAASGLGLPVGLQGTTGNVLLLVAVLAWASMFLFSMQYLRWLAPRLPDQTVFAQADRLMWLLPLLMTAGWLIVIGPVIGFALYFGLLDRVRLDLRAARLERRYEDWPVPGAS